ncbi:MAG: porin family protein [Acidobacteriia bacterium]|nr:porin family protein [Terriglobia bacterium]
MRSTPWFLFAALFFVLRALPAQDLADGWMYRIEVFGEIAHGSLYNGDSSWGKGVDFGGGAGVRPFSGRLRGLGFELRAGRLSDESAAGPSSSRLASHFIAADALYHFRGRTRVQPYVLGGLGIVNAHYTRTCSACVFNMDPVTKQLTPIPYQSDVQDSKAGLTIGFGLKLAVHRHVSIRPEVLFVDTTPGKGPNWGWLRVQAGVGRHF